jgi:hypothetical protein
MVMMFEASVAVVVLFGLSTLTNDGPVYDESGRFAGNYLCIDTASGGVRWNDDSKRWIGTAFKPSDRIIVKVTNAGQRSWESSQGNRVKEIMR